MKKVRDTKKNNKFTTNFKFIDLFAGIGGFRKGLEANGHKCVFSAEIDKHAVKSYAAIYGEDEKDVFNDITKTEEILNKMPEFDIMCSGFPCQPFIRAGRRHGFKDKNKGNLFFNLVSIIEERKPKIVFLENVKGLLTAGEKEEIFLEDGNKRIIEVEKGKTFKEILYELDQLGYDVQWQMLSSAHFIAHNKERVYIVATKRNSEFHDFKRIFPLHKPKKVMNIKDMTMQPEMLYKDFFMDIKPESLYNFHIGEISVRDLMTREDYEFGKISPFGYWGVMIDGKCITAKLNNKPKKVFPMSKHLLSDDKVDPKFILLGNEVEKQRIAKSGKTWKSGNKMGNMAFPDSKEKPSRTITANSSGREMMVLGYGEQINGEYNKFRKLTPLETWRLQGFSDSDFNKAKDAGVADGELKKRAGNAVTVDVIKAIAERL